MPAFSGEFLIKILPRNSHAPSARLLRRPIYVIDGKVRPIGGEELLYTDADSTDTKFTFYAFDS